MYIEIQLQNYEIIMSNCIVLKVNYKNILTQKKKNKIILKNSHWVYVSKFTYLFVTSILLHYYSRWRILNLK